MRFLSHQPVVNTGLILIKPVDNVKCYSYRVSPPERMPSREAHHANYSGSPSKSFLPVTDFVTKVRSRDRQFGTKDLAQFMPIEFPHLEAVEVERGGLRAAGYKHRHRQVE